ncbi:transglutaminase family protein [Phormidium yuhuli AB48]|uniref:Transglutaminase family protein n=1 Tax=Phormidium yuhuli AB48 TaxID=2940671 RepID=A0ABY5ATT5_9CYAN|nr:transglutaminase family protein [Phormidium yuhuli]USR92290.1 transglutaminase family protein [Phormidium yuhuli AB48]
MSQFKIDHLTTYRYNQAVFLKPHLYRLYPHSHGHQRLLSYRLDVTPEPLGRSPVVDLDGNTVIKLWFEKPTTQLQFHSQAQVETLQTNPFEYLLDDGVGRLPIDYPSSLRSQLLPYLNPPLALPQGVDPTAVELAEELLHLADHQTLRFLNDLNQRIYSQCNYVTRLDGDPQPPGITWRTRRGSCRDVTVLFAAVCRAVGLAARFVSGYQEGDPDQQDYDLHAWVEVYLPGAGWRGYDPTHGLAVADGHISVAASPYPRYAAPVQGTVTPQHPVWESGQPLETSLETRIRIEGDRP